MKATYKVLIVDDDPVFVKTTQTILESHGYDVDSAPGGEEALSQIRRNPPDLVLLDVIMGWPLEGVSVSREMLGSRELQRIPIIMCTSIRDSEYRGMFPQDEYLHIDSWLDKPFSPATLLSEVEATLTRYAKRRVRPS